jgi:hypothetical protein
MTEEQLKSSTLTHLLGLKSLVFIYSKRTGEDESEKIARINAELERRYTGEVTEEEGFWYIKEYIENIDKSKRIAFINKISDKLKEL